MKPDSTCTEADQEQDEATESRPKSPQETLTFLQEPCDRSSGFSSHEVTGMNEQEMSQCNLVATNYRN